MDMRSRASHFQCLANSLKTENRILRQEKKTLTEEIAYLKKALEDSSLDDLTGLLRRKMFQDIVEQELLILKRHPGRSLSIMAIDINDLKKINDRYGHPAGDQVIVSFANLLRVSLRDCDIVARTGGDEFLVFLPEQGTEGVLSARAHLLKAFDEQKNIILPAFYGACVGTTTTTYNDSATNLPSFEELYRQADLALYTRKHALREES
jgi:diguanylate cyclase (GGDEF)-like protein